MLEHNYVSRQWFSHMHYSAEEKKIYTNVLITGAVKFYLKKEKINIYIFDIDIFHICHHHHIHKC